MSAATHNTDDERFGHGLHPISSAEEKQAFVEFRLRAYHARPHWRSDNLSEYYSDYFQNFTIEHFKALKADSRRELCDLLRNLVQEKIPRPEDEHEANVDEQEEEGKNDNSPVEDNNKPGPRPESSASRHCIMANLFKAYTNDDDRYSGLTTGNFDRKFMLFVERCGQADIPEVDRRRTFSIMHAGSARQFYFDVLMKQNLDLMSHSKAVKDRFQTPERTRALLREWEALTLESVVSKNLSRSPIECLEMMITKLTDIQSSLPKDYRNDTILLNKILNAERNVESCLLTYHKPEDTVQGVISDLQASLDSTKTVSTPVSSSATDVNEPSVHFVDRRFMRAQSSQNSSRRTSHRRSNPLNARCIVCHKEGCWSSNHPMNDLLNAFPGNKVLRQFLASTDDDTDDEDRQLANAPDDVVIHLAEKSKDENDDDDDVRPFLHNARIEDDYSPAAFVAVLQTISVMHALTKKKPNRFGNTFQDIMIDTRAERESTSGRTQYVAYCRATGREAEIDTRRATVCHFGIGSAKPLGVAIINFPLGEPWMQFELHVVDADVPILLLIDDMDRLGVSLNILTNELVRPKSRQCAAVSHVGGHQFLQWNEHLFTYFTYAELHRLHRRFGHPQVDKLVNLLKRADIDQVDSETRRMLDRIERSCAHCQEYAQRPRRLKITLRDDVDFNYTTYTDIFYIDCKPILHVVDKATRFQAAAWLNKVSAVSLWSALRRCWIDVYLGLPDVITHDAGKNFMARSFAANAYMLHIRKKWIPVESPNSMSIVERYHATVLRALDIVKKKAPDLDNDHALQMAIKSINDSVGSDGLVPTLLVFGATPRLGLPSDPRLPQRSDG